MHYCIPTPTTDSNTSTGMIWVTLNMPSAVEECREPSGNFTLSGEWSPWDESGGIDPLTFSPMTLWVRSSGQQIVPKMIKLWDVKPCYTIRCQKMCFVLLVLLKSLHLNYDDVLFLFASFICWYSCFMETCQCEIDIMLKSCCCLCW